MSEDGTRVALAPTVSQDDVDTATYDLDWLMARKGSGKNAVDSYTSGDQQTQIDVVHDDVIGLPYLIVRGDAEAETVKAIGKALDTVSVAGAKRAYGDATSADDRIRALYLLGVAAKDDAAKAKPTLAKALKDEQDDVRHAAIVAIGYVGGEELERLLRDARENDASEKVRHDAGLMLEALDRRG